MRERVLGVFRTGRERLEGELKPEHLDEIVADVEAFVGDIPQFDDMTMVMIEIGEA